MHVPTLCRDKCSNEKLILQFPDKKVIANDASENMGVLRCAQLETSNNPVVPAQAGTQSVEVLENAMDWIPACAGMTNF